VSGGPSAVDVAISLLNSAFTRAPRRPYSTASQRATSRPPGPWFALLRSDDVRIADVAADLVLVMFRGVRKSAPWHSIRVHGLDIPHANVEEAADPVRIAWRLQGDRRLVVSRSTADIDDDQLLDSAT